jgi:hypothetical protein
MKKIETPLVFDIVCQMLDGEVPVMAPKGMVGVRGCDPARPNTIPLVTNSIPGRLSA